MMYRTLNLDKLSALQGRADFALAAGLSAEAITAVSTDSRRVTAGTLLIACSKDQAAAVHHIQSAVAAGAVAVIQDSQLAFRTDQVPVLAVDQLHQHVGTCLKQFYALDFDRCAVTAVTGTNGKTSMTYLLVQLLHGLSEPAACIGTIGQGLWSALKPTSHTTPAIDQLYQYCHTLSVSNINHIFLEVSSHAIAQDRIQAMQFDTLILSNITCDHLEYHGSVDQYVATKYRLFTQYQHQRALINLDDAYGVQLYALLQKKKSAGLLSYAIERPATYRLRHLKLSAAGIQADFETPEGCWPVRSRLLGRFNAMNLLAVLAYCAAAGKSMSQVVAAVEQLQPVPGRMQSYQAPGTARVLVDYAHTTDALEQVLQTVHEQTMGQIILVFGCGGDRDQAKRAEMGQLASQYADHIIITDDNSRYESAQQIAAQIMSGMAQDRQVDYVSDRALAIQQAIARSAPEDIVLIAGKGHEQYEDCRGQRLFYPGDAQIVCRILGLTAGTSE